MQVGVNYDKAVTCLAEHRPAPIAFDGVPAEHWKHIRSLNLIEGTFATVRFGTATTKGCLSNEIGLAMGFKLAKSADYICAG